MLTLILLSIFFEVFWKETNKINKGNWSLEPLFRIELVIVMHASALTRVLESLEMVNDIK